MLSNLQTITPQIKTICQKHHIRHAAVFGSFACGEQTEESDVDLLVENENPFTLHSYFQLKWELEGHLWRKIDLATWNTLKWFIREEVEKEKVVLF